MLNGNIKSEFFKPERNVKKPRTLKSEIEYFHNLKLKLENDVLSKHKGNENSILEVKKDQEMKSNFRRNSLNNMRKSLLKAIERKKKYDSCLHVSPNHMFHSNQTNSSHQRFRIRNLSSKENSSENNSSGSLLFILENSLNQNKFQENGMNGKSIASRKSPRLRNIPKRRIRRFSVPGQMYRRSGRGHFGYSSVNVDLPYPEMMNTKFHPFKRKSFLPTSLFQTFVSKKPIRKKKKKKMKKKKTRKRVCWINRRKMNNPKKSSSHSKYNKPPRRKIPKRVRKNVVKKRRIRNYMKRKKKYEWDSIKEEEECLNELKGLNRNIYGRTVVIYRDEAFKIMENGIDERIRRSASRMKSNRLL